MKNSKKYISLTILLLFFSSIYLIGQTLSLKVNFGDDVDMRPDVYPSFLDAESNQKIMFTYNEKNKEFDFKLYGEDMKMIKSNIVSLKSQYGKKAYFHATYFRKVKDKTYMIFYQDKGKLKDVYVLEFSVVQLAFVGEPILLLENADASVHHRNQSPDLTKIIFTTEFPAIGAKGSQKQQIGIYVFDEKLQKIIENTVTLAYKESKPTQYIVSNSGIVMTSRQIMTGKQNGNSPNFYFELYSIEKGEKTPNIIKINLGNYYVSEYVTTTLLAGADNSFSFYFDARKSKEDNEAFVFINLEAAKNTYLISDYFSELPKDVINQYVSPSEASNDKATRFSSHHSAYPMPDGSVNLVCFTKADFFTFRVRQVTTHTYESYILFTGIYIINYNKKSKMEWVKKIPVRNIGFDSYFSGFGHEVVIKGNDLLLFFTDIPENRTLTTEQSPIDYERTENRKDPGVLFCAKINPKGSIENFSVGKIMDYPYPLFAGNLVGNDLIQYHINEKHGKKTYTLHDITIR